MEQTKVLLATLKRVLRSQGVRYRDIASHLNHSEANVKRMFSENNMSIGRLEKICQMVGFDLSDLVRQMEADTLKITELTDGQEKELVSDTKLLLAAYLVVNAWSFEEIIECYNFTESELIRLLIRLDKLKLIELLPLNRIKLLVSKQFAWRTNGPIQKYFSQKIQDDYFKSQFDKGGESFRFMSGLLSDASSQLIIQKMEQLVSEYNQLIIEDQKLPLADRFSFSMITAIRPWHPETFAKYLR